jgi:two-component system, OmpR family, response regulator
VNTHARPALRVLIVDDNHDAADTLALLLELRTHARAPYKLRVAYDGIDGLRQAREFLPDCVISDIQMPGLDGYALAQALRADSALAGAKLIALSAFTNDEHIRRATEAGYDYRLTKASDLNELLEVLSMIEAIKELAEKTRQLTEQNVDLAGQTKELLQEVKEDMRELKQDVAELKQEVKELKDDQKAKDDRDTSSGTTPPG